MSNTDTEFNPLTGDADVVMAKARRYEELGLAIARSVTMLGSISEGDAQKSQAIDALKESAKNVARDIGKAEERYSLTATALIGYAGKLKTAQDDAVAAIAAIAAAEGDVTDAQNASNVANTNAEAQGAEQAANQKIADTAADSVTASAQGLTAAHSLWHDARNSKNDAASAAAAQIDDVVNGKVGDKLNDSWWDNHSGILDAIKTICAIAGVLAIFLAWVPILGAILIGLAILGALMALVDAGIKYQRGEGSLTNVIFAAIGVVLAAFGGKLVSYIAKLAKFKSAATLTGLRPGQQGFLNSKGFKTVFGVSKQSARTELKSLTSFKGGLMQIVQNPFSMKLGSGNNLAAKWLSGARTEYVTMAGNPFRLTSTDAPLASMTNGAKVTIGILDYRQIAAPGEKLADAFGLEIPAKPETILQNASNLVESKIRG